METHHSRVPLVLEALLDLPVMNGDRRRFCEMLSRSSTLMTRQEQPSANVTGM